MEGGSGYSASGSASSGFTNQVRTGDINNQSGLQIPGWLPVVAVAGFFFTIIVGAIGFIAWQFTKSK